MSELDLHTEIGRLISAGKHAQAVLLAATEWADSSEINFPMGPSLTELAWAARTLNVVDDEARWGDDA